MEFNPDQFTQEGSKQADKTLLVRFFQDEIEDRHATEREGRPIYKTVEKIEIRIPGKRDPQVVRVARLTDIERFPQHYDLFKKRVEAPIEGTPLSEWPMIKRSLVEQLSFLNVKTVEQLAGMADTYNKEIPGIIRFKEMAKDWLEFSSESKVLAEKKQLEDKVGMLEQRIDQLLQAQTEQTMPPETNPMEPGPLDGISEMVENPELVDVPLKERRTRRRKEKTA